MPYNDNQKSLTAADVQEVHGAIEIIGLRADYKKRKWCPEIADGIPQCGYYSNSYQGQEGGHFIYRARVTLDHTARGQSAYYMVAKLTGIAPTVDRWGRQVHPTLFIGATGVETLMRNMIDNKVQIHGNGSFDFVFTLEKKGANVYAEPFDLSTKYLEVEV